MVFLSVLAQPLAMVGQHDDHRAVVDRHPAQVVEKAAYDGVAPRDLPVVSEGVSAPVGLDRLVGHGRLVDVEEEEEGALLPALEPRTGERSRLVAPALDAPRGVGALRGADPALVEIEPIGAAAPSTHAPR